MSNLQFTLLYSQIDVNPQVDLSQLQVYPTRAGGAAIDTLAAQVGRRIKGERVLRGLSQGALAKLVGYTSQAIWKIEVGRTDLPLSTLAKIAAALGADLCYLVSGRRPPDHELSQRLEDLFSRLPQSTDELPDDPPEDPRLG